VTPLFVSFFTPSYAAEASGLIDTLALHRLPYDIRVVPDLGDWCANCAMKPAFIRDRMQEHWGRPIVWLDADARVRRHPDLFATLDCDFAAHWRHGAELLSGTMYFGPTAEARSLATVWADEQLRAPGVWDQQVLQRVLDNGFAVRVQRLPAEYTRVFDDDKMGSPVIEHLQASRRLAVR
jgi:hypothetical protein